MTTELITINDSYTEQCLKVFAKWGITYPKEGDIVELVRVDKLLRVNKIGLIVKPHDGQYIKDIAHGLEIEKEVSFDKSRFTTLLGESITEEMLKEFKQTKDFLQPVEKLVKEDILKQLTKNNEKDSKVL